MSVSKSNVARRGDIWRDTMTGELHELKQSHEVTKFNELVRKRHNRYRFIGKVGE